MSEIIKEALNELKEDFWGFDDNDDDVVYLYRDEDGKYRGSGEIISAKADSLKELIEKIEEKANDYDLEMYSDVKIDTDEVDWEEEDPDDLGQVTVTWIAAEPEEEEEITDLDFDKPLDWLDDLSLKEFVNENIEDWIYDYDVELSPENFDYIAQIAQEEIETYSDKKVSTDLLLKLFNELND